MISDVSDLLLPPPRFMVKCVCGPLNPNFFAATLERRLVLEPESNMASILMNSPSELSTLTF